MHAWGISENSDLKETIMQICTWMRQSGFSRPEPPNPYDFLDNFLHSDLFDRDFPSPLVAIYIFVCVARRLALDAWPVPFPHIALAIVSPATDAIYVNVFMSTNPILSYPDLSAMLQTMDLPPNNLPESATPANAETMLNRVFVAIFGSISRAVS